MALGQTLAHDPINERLEKREEPIKRRYDASAQRPPRPINFYGLAITPILYGALHLDVMHDFNALGLTNGPAPNEFITSLIPAPNSPFANQTNRTTYSVNQTQLNAGFSVPTALGKALLFTQIYFEQNVSGGPVFDLYLAYGVVGGLRAGKAWSTFSNVPAIPDTLDFEGPNAIPEMQSLMLRYSIYFSDNLRVAFAAEAPDAQITMPTGTDTSTASALNQYPDAIMRWTATPGQSTIQLSGMYRRVGARGTRIAPGTTESVGFNSAVNTWAGQFTGNLAFNKSFHGDGGWFGRTFGLDSLQYGVVYGTGVGAYVQDTFDVNLDAAPSTENAGTFRALRMVTGWGGLQHYWTPDLRSTGSFGYVNVFDPPKQQDNTYKSALYVSGNLILTLLSALDVGVEYMYGNLRTVAAGTGHNSRLQVSTIWHYGI